MIEILSIGALALNMTLAGVADTRNTYFEERLPYKHYECLIGVPNKNKHYLGEEVYFYDGEVHGPWLVVDVAQDAHRGYMFANGLAADINCPELVHQRGYLYVITN